MDTVLLLPAMFCALAAQLSCL